MYEYFAELRRVVDGDTIDVDIDLYVSACVFRPIPKQAQMG